MKKRLTLEDVVSKLEWATLEAGSQKAFADKIGVSPQYVSDVLHHRREPGDSILDGLSLRKVVYYESKEAA